MNRYVEILDNLLNDIHNDKEKFVKDVYISTFTFADPVIVFRTFENSDNIDCLKKCMLYMGFLYLPADMQINMTALLSAKRTMTLLIMKNR